MTSDIIPPENWLTAAQFAAEMGTTQRNAQRVLKAAHDHGKPWRGMTLNVRTVQGFQGGHSGTVHQVAASGLGAPAAKHPSARPGHDPANARDCAPAPKDATERYRIIRRVLQAPRGSSERSRAVKDVMEQTGRSRRWVYKLIEDYEKDGTVSVVRKQRSDKGKRLCHISRAWDNAVPFDDATKARIGKIISDYCKSWWASRAVERGRHDIGQIASSKLARLTIAEGYDPGYARLKEICRLPKDFVARDRLECRNVAMLTHDRKKFKDTVEPHQRRTRLTGRPMDVVIPDVHPMDFLLPRGDGTTFTARLIVYEDYATARLFVFPVYPDKGRDVRMEHVYASFCKMARDRDWGVPLCQYIDNGSEFNIVENMIPLMQRAHEWGALEGLRVMDLDHDRELRAELSEGSSFHRIIRALPYNPAAKTVEPALRKLERKLSAMLGWVGGDRMNKPTVNLGQKPETHPDGKDQFEEYLRAIVDEYNNTPITNGEMKGKSPNDIYRGHVAAGWQPIVAHEADLIAASCRDLNETRVCRQSVVRYDDKYWKAPELLGMPKGMKLRLHKSAFSYFAPALVLSREDGRPFSNGKTFCVAWQDVPTGIGNKDAAKDIAQRKQGARRNVKAYGAQIPDIDPMKEIAEMNEFEALTRPAGTSPDFGRTLPPKEGNLELVHDMGKTRKELGNEKSADLRERAAKAKEDKKRRETGGRVS